MEVTSGLFRLHLICGGAVAWARPVGFATYRGRVGGSLSPFWVIYPASPHSRTGAPWLPPACDATSVSGRRPLEALTLTSHNKFLGLFRRVNCMGKSRSCEASLVAAYWWPNDAADSKTLEGHSPQPRDPARAPCRARLSTPRHAPASGPRLPRRGPASPLWGTARPRPSPGRAWDCSPHPAGSCAVL